MDIFYMQGCAMYDLFWYSISSCLDTKDVINCIKSFPYLKNKDMFYNYMINKIINRLKTFIPNLYDKIIKYLKDTDSIISGSFISQCINDNYRITDIDIFTNEKYKEKFLELFKESRMIPKRDHGYDYIQPSAIYEICSGDNNYKVQFIIVDGNPKDKVIKESDFTVCKNYLYYDKQSIGALKLHIEHLNHHLNGYTDICIYHNDDERNYKYLDIYKIKTSSDLTNAETLMDHNDNPFFDFEEDMVFQLNKKIYISEENFDRLEIIHQNRMSWRKKSLSNLIMFPCNDSCILDKFYLDYKHIHFFENSKIIDIRLSNIIITDVIIPDEENIFDI